MTVDYGDGPLLGLPELAAVSQRSCTAYNKNARRNVRALVYAFVIFQNQEHLSTLPACMTAFCFKPLSLQSLLTVMPCFLAMS